MKCIGRMYEMDVCIVELLCRVLRTQLRNEIKHAALVCLFACFPSFFVFFFFARYACKKEDESADCYGWMLVFCSDGFGDIPGGGAAAGEVGNDVGCCVRN